MNVLLVALNAKYIHTNLAIRSLQSYLSENSNHTATLLELTINQSFPMLLENIYQHKPIVLGISCYIWNYDLVVKLSRELKKLLPKTILFLGGPEVSFDPLTVLNQTGCDFVMRGEGEQPLLSLMNTLDSEKSWKNVLSLSWLENKELIETPTTTPLSLDKIPFVYANPTEKDSRIVYYEASRGCPFRCGYCLSSATSGVRLLSLKRAKSDLSILLARLIPQVKLVDRTFNANPQFAMNVWRFLQQHDNGVTNFHFELSAELLTDDMLDYLATVRKGLFQFEIGIQSTNQDTLQAVGRPCDFQRLSYIVERLSIGNIHLHLDLIAGLPFENYQRFGQSFDDVYALKPEQFQLGFLKLLKGSRLYQDREKYDFIYTDHPPYEILSTHVLSFDDITRLKCVEEVLELYYNSGRFKESLQHLLTFFDSSFKLFEQLGLYLREQNPLRNPLTFLRYYDILYHFAKIQNIPTDTLKWLIRFDLFSHEKAKTLPSWMNDTNLLSLYRKKIYDFYSNTTQTNEYLSSYQGMDTKQLMRQTHIDIFPFNPISKVEEVTAILFDYRNKARSAVLI